VQVFPVDIRIGGVTADWSQFFVFPNGDISVYVPPDKGTIFSIR
jgi:hypothetical protein